MLFAIYAGFSSTGVWRWKTDMDSPRLISPDLLARLVYEELKDLSEDDAILPYGDE